MIKKGICALMCVSLLILSGCGSKKEEADKRYSGCTFVVKSGEYYNVGVEIHYDDEYQFTWSHDIEDKMHSLLDPLTVKDAEPVEIVDDGKYYCTDIKRSGGKSWRTGFAIPESSHDQMIQRLDKFSFPLTLQSRYTNTDYTSEVTLPVVDVSIETTPEPTASSEAQ